MASIINAQTSPLTAVIIEADNTGNLDIQTANTTAIAISSSQVVSLTNPLPASSGGTGATSLSGITVGTSTNIAGGAANRIPFQTEASTTSFVAAPTVSNTALLWNGSAFTWGAASSPPGGSNTQVQYNSSGTFAGSANLTFDGTSLTCGGPIIGANGTTADINNANDTGSLSVRGNASFPASISFHRTGVYAINMGLSTGNNFVIGGWSASANAFSMTGAGALTMLNNITAYSDERVKTNWRDLPSDFIEQLAKVKHGIYDRTDQESTQIGVGAQSLRPVMEHAVMEDENGNLSVAYGNAALVAAIELAKQVVELKKEIELLKAK